MTISLRGSGHPAGRGVRRRRRHPRAPSAAAVAAHPAAAGRARDRAGRRAGAAGRSGPSPRLAARPGPVPLVGEPADGDRRRTSPVRGQIMAAAQVVADRRRCSPPARRPCAPSAATGRPRRSPRPTPAPVAAGRRRHRHAHGSPPAARRRRAGTPRGPVVARLGRPATAADAASPSERTPQVGPLATPRCRRRAVARPAPTAPAGRRGSRCTATSAGQPDTRTRPPTTEGRPSAGTPAALRAAAATPRHRPRRHRRHRTGATPTAATAAGRRRASHGPRPGLPRRRPGSSAAADGTHRITIKLQPRGARRRPRDAHRAQRRGARAHSRRQRARAAQLTEGSPSRADLPEALDARPARGQSCATRSAPAPPTSGVRRPASRRPASPTGRRTPGPPDRRDAGRAPRSGQGRRHRGAPRPATQSTDPDRRPVAARAPPHPPGCRRDDVRRTAMTVSAVEAHARTSGRDRSATYDRRQHARTDLDKDMFLQLLVAQMRNQDPMNPHGLQRVPRPDGAVHLPGEDAGGRRPDLAAGGPPGRLRCEQPGRPHRHLRRRRTASMLSGVVSSVRFEATGPVLRSTARTCTSPTSSRWATAAPTSPSTPATRSPRTPHPRLTPASPA